MYVYMYTMMCIYIYIHAHKLLYFMNYYIIHSCIYLRYEVARFAVEGLRTQGSERGAEASRKGTERLRSLGFRVLDP